MTKLVSKDLKKTAGFTLIEILVVIGIIAILAAIVIIAINPAKQFAQARNTQRQAGVNTILSAVGQRLADNKGIFAGQFTVGGTTYICGILPTATSSTPNITTGQATTVTTVTGALGCLVPTYVATLPTDPDVAWATGFGATNTGFDVIVDGTGRITVCAERAKSESSIPGSPAICVTR